MQTSVPRGYVATLTNAKAVLLRDHQQQPPLDLVPVQPAAKQLSPLLNDLGVFLWVIALQQLVEVLEEIADLLCLVRLIAGPLRLWGLVIGVFLGAEKSSP